MMSILCVTAGLLWDGSVRIGLVRFELVLFGSVRIGSVAISFGEISIHPGGGRVR